MKIGHGHWRKRSIIIEDDALALTICDSGVDGIAEVNEEGFVRLLSRVAFDLHGNSPDGLSRRERQVAARGRIVAGAGLTPERSFPLPVPALLTLTSLASGCPIAVETIKSMSSINTTLKLSSFIPIIIDGFYTLHNH